MTTRTSVLLAVLIAVLVGSADLITKTYAITHSPDVVLFHTARAFPVILAGLVFFFSMIWLFYSGVWSALVKQVKWVLPLAVGLVGGGIIGNGYDVISQQQITDWIQWRNSTFNIADCSLLSALIIVAAATTCYLFSHRSRAVRYALATLCAICLPILALGFSYVSSPKTLKRIDCSHQCVTDQTAHPFR